jgi:hypothetical protein
MTQSIGPTLALKPLISDQGSATKCGKDKKVNRNLLYQQDLNVPECYHPKCPELFVRLLWGRGAAP